MIEPYRGVRPRRRGSRSGATIRAFSHLEKAVVRTRPSSAYARLRRGARHRARTPHRQLRRGEEREGGRGAKANHLTYHRRRHGGARANIEAGTIFCNYDGFDRSETHVGRGRLHRLRHGAGGAGHGGRGAFTGSGSVITEDVPPNALATGRGRQVVEARLGHEAFRALKRANRKPK